MIDPVLQMRLANIGSSLAVRQVLGQEEVQAKIEEIQGLLARWACGKDDGTSRVVADEEPARVREWLNGLPIRTSGDVMVLWPHFRTGVVVPYLDFTAHYDDLWYPGEDDVWVTDLQGNWLLELSHEEMFRLMRRS